MAPFLVQPVPGFSPQIGLLVSMMNYVRLNTLGLNVNAATSERTRLGAALGDEARAKIRGHALPHYLDRLEAVRARTLAAFAALDDDWLAEQQPFGNQVSANNHFKWFHVFEDELSHRGQILLIRRRLPED